MTLATGLRELARDLSRCLSWLSQVFNSLSEDQETLRVEILPVTCHVEISAEGSASQPATVQVPAVPTVGVDWDQNFYNVPTGRCQQRTYAATCADRRYGYSCTG